MTSPSAIVVLSTSWALPRVTPGIVAIMLKPANGLVQNADEQQRETHLVARASMYEQHKRRHTDLASMRSWRRILVHMKEQNPPKCE